MVFMSDHQRPPLSAGVPLPSELLYYVFWLLDFEDQVRCQRVCKGWNTLLKHPQVFVWHTVILTDGVIGKGRQPPTVGAADSPVELYSPLTECELCSLPKQSEKALCLLTRSSLC